MLPKEVINEETNTSEKFQNAEQLWFWFMYSKSVQNGFTHNHSNIRRPCEILDVETLVTKLYLCGKLSDEQLVVLKKVWGQKTRPTSIYIQRKSRSSTLEIRNGCHNILRFSQGLVDRLTTKGTRYVIYRIFKLFS